jgi:hypothetical protein
MKNPMKLQKVAVLSSFLCFAAVGAIGAGVDMQFAPSKDAIVANLLVSEADANSRIVDMRVQHAGLVGQNGDELIKGYTAANQVTRWKRHCQIEHSICKKVTIWSSTAFLQQ